MTAVGRKRSYEQAREGHIIMHVVHKFSDQSGKRRYMASSLLDIPRRSSNFSDAIYLIDKACDLLARQFNLVDTQPNNQRAHLQRTLQHIPFILIYYF